jgi:hypothetical protein
MNEIQEVKINLAGKEMAIFIAGQILGLAATLNVDVLEEYLNSPKSAVFTYHKECHAIIKMHRQMFKKKSKSPSRKNEE